MVKTIISTACVLALLIGGAIAETNYIRKQFDDFNQVLCVLYEKVDDEVAVESDVYAVQDFWLNKKKHLHAFIPHTEIKEIDLWLAESVTLVRDKEWEDAISKIEVLKELTEQIPKTFIISWENVL
ncbi:MAG: DUF4363 family protein [Clostridia bacterium]|nr:DUF4363 family protein [Clostridia bacterium]